MAKHAGWNADGAKLWLLENAFPTQFQRRASHQEREWIKLRGRQCEIEQLRERDRVRGRERAICFERSFQVAISSVLIDNSPWLTMGTLCPSPQCCCTRTRSVIHDDDYIEISIEKTLLTLFIFCFVSFFGNCTENISIGKGQKRTKLAITLHFTVGGNQR